MRNATSDAIILVLPTKNNRVRQTLTIIGYVDSALDSVNSAPGSVNSAPAPWIEHRALWIAHQAL